MRREPYPITRITQGLDKSIDALLLTDQASPNLELVRFHKGVLKKDLGWQDFGDTMSEIPMHMDTFYEVDGTSHFMCWSVDFTYSYSGTAWGTKITGCNTWTGDEDNQFWSIQMPDNAGTQIVISGNGKDYPQKWDGTTWAALGGWTAATYIPWQAVVFNNYMISLGSTEGGTQCPFRIRWTDTADPEDVTTGNADFFDLVDTADWVTGGKLMGNRCFIFKERSIWELIHVGGTDVFEARLVIDGVGTYAIHTVVSLGDELVFFGSDDVYLFDGVRLKPIGKQMFHYLYDTETKIVNHTKINRASAVYVEELAEYWCCLPTGTVDPDWVIKYNFDEESWSQRDLQVQCWGYYNVGTAQTLWSAATSAWNSGNWAIPWRRKGLPGGAPTTIYADDGGEFYEDDRTETTTDEMLWESKDFVFAHGERVLEIRFRVKGGDFDTCHSQDGGVSYSTWETLSPSSTEFREVVQYVNLTTQTLRIKIRTTSTVFELQWLEPWFIKRKRSKDLF